MTTEKAIDTLKALKEIMVDDVAYIGPQGKVYQGPSQGFQGVFPAVKAPDDYGEYLAWKAAQKEKEKEKKNMMTPKRVRFGERKISG
jgi:hypothetical protein